MSTRFACKKLSFTSYRPMELFCFRSTFNLATTLKIRIFFNYYSDRRYWYMSIVYTSTWCRTTIMVKGTVHKRCHAKLDTRCCSYKNYLNEWWVGVLTYEILPERHSWEDNIVSYENMGRFRWHLLYNCKKKNLLVTFRRHGSSCLIKVSSLTYSFFALVDKLLQHYYVNPVCEI